MDDEAGDVAHALQVDALPDERRPGPNTQAQVCKALAIGAMAERVFMEVFPGLSRPRSPVRAVP